MPLRQPVGRDLHRDGDPDRPRQTGERGGEPSGARCRACGPIPTRVATAGWSSSSCSRWTSVDTGSRCGSRLAASRAALSGSTRSSPSGAISSVRWSAAGVTTTSRPSRASTRAVSAPLRGANTTSTRSTTPSRTGQPRPAVGDHGHRPRVRPRRATGRVARRVEDDADRSGHPVEHAGEVVPGAPADVEQRPGGLPRRHRVRERRADAVVVAAVQERHPVGDHVRRVARGRPVPGRQQADVPLPGPVEQVPGGAPQRGLVVVGGQSATADGAGQQRHGGRRQGRTALTSAAGPRGR